MDEQVRESLSANFVFLAVRIDIMQRDVFLCIDSSYFI